tara:strand:- start:152 stop:907 length:756 start_codon:yes stop_codon:yes gene_type:complete
MKNLLLTFILFFSFSLNAQYAIMSAVDLNDGAEEDYLKLEKFWSAIHQEAVDQGLQTGWSVWKRTPKEGDEANAAEYLIFDQFSSMEQLEKGYNGVELAQKAYKGKMSKRSIQRMMDGTGSESRQRRNYVIQVIDATILAGGDYKPGDVATINLMSKKTDDFEQYENEVWKPVAERNILSGNSRHWILAQVKDRADNSFEGFTHFVWNLKGNPEVEFEGNSGFKWDKLWEGLESSRDMQDSEEYTLIYIVN